MHFLQTRWERLSEHLVRQVQLENVWVGLRTANRGRPDQTPGSADKGAKTPGQNEFLFLFLHIIYLYFKLSFKWKYFNIGIIKGTQSNTFLFTELRVQWGIWVYRFQSDIGELPPGMYKEGDSSPWPSWIRKNSADVLFRTTVGTWTSTFTYLNTY